MVPVASSTLVLASGAAILPHPSKVLIIALRVLFYAVYLWTLVYLDPITEANSFKVCLLLK
jgi:hypothetical protein